MEKTYKIVFDEKSNYFMVDDKRVTMSEAADDFRKRMFFTLVGMKEGNLSKAIKLTVEEIEP